MKFSLIVYYINKTTLNEKKIIDVIMVSYFIFFNFVNFGALQRLSI